MSVYAAKKVRRNASSALPQPHSFQQEECHMKKLSRILFLFTVLCLTAGALGICASAAQSVSVPDRTPVIALEGEEASPFSFQFKNGEATLTGYNDMAAGRPSHLEIPSTAVDSSGQSCPVTAIADEVFKNCSWITSVSIPGSVTKIGSSVFQGCGLTSVTVPASVKSWGHFVFADCSSLSSAVIEDGITEVPPYMFRNCASLTSVQLPESVTVLNSQCFQDTGLTSITLPSGLTVIGENAFLDSELTSITLPDGLTKIDSYAFAYTPLTSIQIPDSVTTIGGHAFDQTALTTVTIPDSVTSLGGQAFYKCTRLRSATIGAGLTRMWGTFTGCDELTDVTIGENVSTLDETFRGCTSLKTLTLPASVKAIYKAFWNCSNLEIVYLKSMTAPEFQPFYTDNPQVFVIPKGATGFDAEIWRNYTILYEGDPLPKSAITLSPTSIDFGSLMQGYASDELVSKTVTVTNTGDKGVTLLQPSSLSDFKVERLDRRTLSPGQSATLSVSPKYALRPGTYSDTLTISTQDGVSASLSLSFAVGELYGKITADRTSIDFGSVEEGYTQPAPVTVTFTNSGTASMSLALNSTSLDSFIISEPSRSSVEPNQSATLTVQPKAGLKSGTYKQTLKIIWGDGYRIEIPITFTVGNAGASGMPFTDVDPGIWYYDTVKYVYERGLMNGGTASTFVPYGRLSRAMVAQVLYNLAGTPAAESAGFADVPASAWYADAVNWAAETGVVTGYSAQTFGPEDNVTREQLAVMFCRYAKSVGLDTTQDDPIAHGFYDYGTISGWALDAVNWAYKVRLITGKTGNLLDPSGTATRIELAIMLMRFTQL